jgi:hypothetical protein
LSASGCRMGAWKMVPLSGPISSIETVAQWQAIGLPVIVDFLSRSLSSPFVAACRLAAARLQRYKMAVITIGILEQLLMAALFHNLAVLQKHNVIRMGDRR